jgi:hypothetical protein
VTEEATDNGQQNAGADGQEEADWLKELRKDAREAKTLRQENATLKRTKALDDIGVPTTGAGKLFRDTWTGDPDDLDALRTTAREYDLVPAENAPSPEETQAAVAAADSMAEVAQGGASTPTADALIGEATSMDDIERIANDAGVGVPIR